MKLISPFPNITIYKDKLGRTIARQKPVRSKKRKAAELPYHMVCTNAAFTEAATAGKLIRYAFRHQIQKIDDSLITSRLLQACMGVIKAGPQADRRHPKFFDGDPSLLDNFQFNLKAPIDDAFHQTGFTNIEIDDAQVSMRLPSFVPAAMIQNRKGGGSHYKLRPVMAAFDTAAGKIWLAKEEEPDAPLPLDQKLVPPKNLRASIDITGDIVLLFALGLEFYWQTGEGQWSPVAGGHHDALGILRAVKLHIE